MRSGHSGAGLRVQGSGFRVLGLRSFFRGLLKVSSKFLEERVQTFKDVRSYKHSRVLGKVDQTGL